MRLGQWVAGLAAGAAMLMAAAPALAGVMPLSEFRLEVRDAIARLSPKTKVTLEGEDTLHVVLPGAKAAEALSLYVGNAYERYVNDPEALDAIVSQMARTTLTVDTSMSATQESLVVLIRPASYVSQPGFDKLEFLTRPFAGDLIEIVAVDGEETFQMTPADRITSLFPNVAAAWARAEANTRAKMGQMDIEAMEPGVWTVTNESSLALNLVDQPDTWAVHGLKITGDPVAVFMQRNLLLLADGGDKERLERLAMFVKQVAGDPEIMSTTIFTRHNGVWSVLEQRP